MDELLIKCPKNRPKQRRLLPMRHVSLFSVSISTHSTYCDAARGALAPPPLPQVAACSAECEPLHLSSPRGGAAHLPAGAARPATKGAGQIGRAAGRRGRAEEDAADEVRAELEREKKGERRGEEKRGRTQGDGWRAGEGQT